MKVNPIAIEFMYEVYVDPEDVINEGGRLRLTENGKKKAYEMLTEGITDDEGGEWFPRYEVKCLALGRRPRCRLEAGHEGEHREREL